MLKNHLLYLEDLKANYIKMTIFGSLSHMMPVNNKIDL